MEMQGANYTPTDEFKDHPNLQATVIERENEQSKANANLGETQLDVNNPDLAAQAAAQKAQQISANQLSANQNQNQVTTGQTEIGNNAGSQAQYNIDAVLQAQKAAQAQKKPTSSIKG